jgi:hypothetical protein
MMVPSNKVGCAVARLAEVKVLGVEAVLDLRNAALKKIRG